jgi:tryptophan 2,3-dioxygenase
VISKCQDFSEEVAITVLYILNHPETLQAQVVRNVLKFEAGFLDFLDSHILLVDHHLGNRRGTGRSAGGDYLRHSKLA